MKENEATISIEALGGKSVHIVDFPGHERLRPKLKDFIPITGAIVFLVDAVEAESQVRQTAEYVNVFFATIAKKMNVTTFCNDHKWL